MTADTIPERRPLHALLSPDAHREFVAWAAELGVSITGLVEALALELHDLDLEHIGRRARRIDADRRSRQGGYR